MENLRYQNNEVDSNTMNSHEMTFDGRIDMTLEGMSANSSTTSFNISGKQTVKVEREEKVLWPGL